MVGIWRHLSAALLGVSALSMQGHGIADQPATAFIGDNSGVASSIEDRFAEASRVNLGDCVAGAAPALQSPYETMCRDIGATVAALIAGEERQAEPRAQTARLPLQPKRRAIIQQRAAFRKMPHENVSARCFIDESGATWTRNPRAPTFERASTRRVEQTTIAAPALPGVLLSTWPDCALRSPVGGQVVFAGPLKGYLGMVIIKLMGRRHLVVAGLGGLAVKAGDTVARGQILGRSAMKPSPALSGNLDAQGAPLIYLEMRGRGGATGTPGWLR